MWQHLSSVDKSCIPMHTYKQKPSISNPYRSATFGDEVIDNAFWFLQVMRRGPAEIAEPAEDGILIGVSRVSSWVTANLRKGQTALKDSADEWWVLRFAQEACLGGSRWRGCGKSWTEKALRRLAKLAKLVWKESLDLLWLSVNVAPGAVSPKWKF
jgi:hypothetical protein